MKYDYKTRKDTSDRIKKLWPEFLQTTSAHSCDKHGFGFQKDSRFSIFQCDLSLDTWTGYFGNSGCSTFGSVGNKDLFKEYFIKWMNSNLSRMFKEIADAIEKDSEEARAERIKQLEDELKSLQE